jgi:hypothetical protein
MARGIIRAGYYLPTGDDLRNQAYQTIHQDDEDNVNVNEFHKNNSGQRMEFAGSFNNSYGDNDGDGDGDFQRVPVNSVSYISVSDLDLRKPIILTSVRVGSSFTSIPIVARFPEILET